MAALIHNILVAQNITGTGTIGFIPRFSNTTVVQNSAIFQSTVSGINRVGINGTAPAGIVDVFNACSGTPVPALLLRHPTCSFPNTTGSFIQATQGSATRFVVTSSGNTGINVVTPAAQLEVQSNAAGTDIALFRNNTAATVATLANNGNLTLATGNFLITNGNAGIGTSNPAARLDVNWNGISPASAFRVTNGSATLFNVIDGKVGIGEANLAGYGQLAVKNLFGSSNALDLIANTSNPAGQGWINQIRFSTLQGFRHTITDNGDNGRLLIIPGQGAGATNMVQVSGRLAVGNQVPGAAYPNWQMGVDGDLIAKKVIVQTTSWADKVFNANYELKSLAQVEEYIKANKHLPEIPTEAEVIEKGIDVGEMNRLLLQKVEELTLYVIAQQKQIEVLRKKQGL